jgi:hypothetical protein
VGPRLGGYEFATNVFGRSLVFSMSGDTTTEVRAGSVEWPLFFEMTAVELTTNGQSFTIPRGAGARVGSVEGCFELRAIRFFALFAAQQSCDCPGDCLA